MAFITLVLQHKKLDCFPKKNVDSSKNQSESSTFVILATFSFALALQSPRCQMQTSSFTTKSLEFREFFVKTHMMSSSTCTKTVALGKSRAAINRPVRSLGQTLLLPSDALSKLNRLDMHPDTEKDGVLANPIMDRIQRPSVDLNGVLEQSYVFVWLHYIL